MGLPLGFPALAAGMTGSALYGIKRVAEGEEKRKNAGKNKREADAEIKRESRGVEKPANFDAIEEAKQEAKDSATAKKQDKAYNESLTTENKSKGGIVGSASKRADGIATRGKTNCKMY